MRQESGAETVYSVRAVERVLDILDVLQRASGAVSLGEVAEGARLPKSSTFRYLSTLESRRYVEREEDTGSFRLGLAFLPFHTRQFEVLGNRAKPILRELRDRFEETTNLGVLDGSRVAYLEIVESPRTTRMAARGGDRDPIHSTALGKAIAAGLPEEEVRRILMTEGMPQLTPNTITDVETLLEAIAEVGLRGYAVDDRENVYDGRCVAAPVKGLSVPTAISLSAPATRLKPSAIPDVADALVDAAARIAPEKG
ncbi:MAG: IclR family transcriptional regulator [Acidimicrobiia bacterium]